MAQTESCYSCPTFPVSFEHFLSDVLGELVDYAIRIEFQARGSPHAHTILWIKDSPKLGEQSDEEECAFIDRYVKCDVPVEMMMWHNLSPKFKSTSIQLRAGEMEDVDFIILGHQVPHTLIAREIMPDMCSDDETKDAQKALLEVRKVLEDKNTPDDNL